MEKRNELSDGHQRVRRFADWLRENDICPKKAERLMQLAGDTEEVREERKAKDSQRKREERAAKKQDKFSWERIAIEEQVLVPGSGGSRQALRGKIDAIDPTCVEKKDDAALRAVCRQILDQASGSLEERCAAHRAEVVKLSETAQQKFDRLIEREKRLLGESFQMQVNEGIKAQLADRITHLENLREKAASREQRYTRLIAGIKPIINKDDYRFLLNVLHPDRAPDDRKDKFSKAFDIIRKLDSYIEAA